MNTYTLNTVILETETLSTIRAATVARARMMAQDHLKAALKDRPGVNAYVCIGRGEGEEVEWLGALDYDAEAGAFSWDPDR